MFPSQWHRVAHDLAQSNQTSGGDSDDQLYRRLVTTQAHLAAGADIFVSTAPSLLSNRDKRILQDANVRTPREAAKIVGLYLRSRDNYTCQANLGFRGRWAFYWALARHHLPGMWRYFSACVLAGDSGHDDTLGLGGAILHRASRALQARDAIGFQYYLPQDNDTRERMLYHFDYLTLLLSGAFDAQARVARRTYGIAKPKKDSLTSFRNDEFVRELGSTATQLSKVVTTEHRATIDLVSGLRNTIHGVPLTGMGHETSSRAQDSYIEIPRGLIREDLVHELDSDPLGQWGRVTGPPSSLFEPYTFSVTLVERCLVAIDSIARATEVERLFPRDCPVPVLGSEAPADGLFAFGPRFAVLG